MAGDENNRIAASQDKRMDEVMGVLLRTGVVLAAAVVLLGGVVYVAHYRTPASDYGVFHGEPEELRSVSGIFHEALAFSGRGLIQFGLLILIATPISRVAFSLIAFLYQRDWKYVVITAAVLGLLVYSLVGAHA